MRMHSADFEMEFLLLYVLGIGKKLHSLTFNCSTVCRQCIFYDFSHKIGFCWTVRILTFHKSNPTVGKRRGT